MKLCLHKIRNIRVFNIRILKSQLQALLTILLGISLFCFTTASVALPPKNLGPIIAELESQIQSEIQNKRIPGCAIAIVYRNQIVLLKGYGVRTIGKTEKIDIDTVFQLGSVSKPVAATLAVLLEQQGYINLDHPVNYYLPNFALKGQKDPEDLKVRNLLSHTSGIPRGGFNNLIETHTPFDKILKSLQTIKPVAKPGKKYDYNNAMYSVIASVTEKSTRESFPQTLTQKLLRPLNMTRTTANHAGILYTENRATPHTRSKKGLLPAGTYTSSYYNVAPAGGINSTAKDMAHFLQAQLGGAPTVVTNKMLNRMQTPEVITNNLLNFYEGASTRLKNPRYGLGWRLLDFAGERLVFHSGWLKGFTNFLGFLPDHQVGIVILHNSDTRFSSRLGVKFFELFLDLPKLSIPKAVKTKGKQKVVSKTTTNKPKAVSVNNTKAKAIPKNVVKTKAVKTNTVSKSPVTKVKTGKKKPKKQVQ